MVAATILVGRALQPIEHLIGGWRMLVDARGAWQRLARRAQARRPRRPRSSCRRRRAGSNVERVVFGPRRRAPP